MTDEGIWQKVDSLRRRGVAAISGIKVKTGDKWDIVVVVKLYEAYEMLDSVFLLLEKGYGNSADVLTRSLFEVAVNLWYIAKDVEGRLPEYLRHGGFPVSREETEELERRLRQETAPEVKELVPGNTWRPIGSMCKDLGWSEEYLTFYRFVSTVGHSGSFKLGSSYMKLVKEEKLSDWDKSVVLAAALCFYLRVLEIAAKAFPKEIKGEEVAELSRECNGMRELFAER